MLLLFKLQMVLFLTFVVFFIVNSDSISPQKPYSKKELLAIEEFRPMVSRLLTMDFQTTDAYLLRWIRHGNFDLRSARKHLEKVVRKENATYTKHSNWNLTFDTFHKYRENNNIDSILESDETGTENPRLIPNPRKYLSYNMNGHDRAGRPLLYFPFGKWNIRKYVIAGQLEIAYRNQEEMLERLTRKAFQEAATLGKDIDQFYMLGDLNGYSLREMGCIACLPVIANWARTAIAYGPFWKNLTTINVPRIANPVVSLVKSIVGDGLPLNVYDFDKAAWQKKLLKEISLDQLPPTLQ